jgi:hypothetical protein
VLDTELYATIYIDRDDGTTSSKEYTCEEFLTCEINFEILCKIAEVAGDRVVSMIMANNDRRTVSDPT